MPAPVSFRRLSQDAAAGYPGRAARDRLTGWARSLADRLAAADAAEAAEDGIVRGVVEALKRDYPDYPRYQPSAWAKAYRDVQLVFRHNVNAMVRDDLDGLEAGFLNWLRTILGAFVYHSPRFVRDTYVLLKAGAKRDLPGGAFALLEPYLDRTLAVLSDVPAEFVEGPRPATSAPAGPTAADAVAADVAAAPFRPDAPRGG